MVSTIKKVYAQKAIYRGDGVWSWNPSNPPTYKSELSAGDIEKWASNRWGKSRTITARLFNSDAVSEIENKRPFFNMIPGHFRLYREYVTHYGYTYLRLNDPLPVCSRMVIQDYLNAHVAVKNLHAYI